MIGFCPLASGSKGNSIYISDGKTKILIDAGISLKSLTERLHKIGVSVDEIDAILVTHEHIDHIRGVFFVRNGEFLFLQIRKQQKQLFKA
jgi:phosphoribosyl 1,2-cyclic phosphodiesterase